MVYSQGCQRPLWSLPCRQIKHKITFIYSPSSIFKAFGGELPSVPVTGWPRTEPWELDPVFSFQLQLPPSQLIATCSHARLILYVKKNSSLLHVCPHSYTVTISSLRFHFAGLISESLFFLRDMLFVPLQDPTTLLCSCYDFNSSLLNMLTKMEHDIRDEISLGPLQWQRGFTVSV